MIDIKGFTEEEHNLITGTTNKTVIENFRFLAGMDKIYEVRTVIVPEITDNEKMVDNISKLISEYNSDIKYKIIKFRQNGVREDVLKAYTPNDAYMNKLKRIALKNGLKDVVVV